MRSSATRGPLVLGAGGRVGRMFRRLASEGLWPGPEPVWHTRDGRDGTLAWDFTRTLLPDWGSLPEVSGIIVLAGATREDPALAGESLKRRAFELGLANEAPARAALAFARDRGVGRVLLCSSAAVYGSGPGTHREDSPADPSTSYGMAKLFMEEEAAVDLGIRGGPPTCALRIGNVAGADMLFGAAARGPVVLDRFPDGTGPRRAYVGPLTLARAMVALLGRDGLPPVLNLAQPGLVAMEDLLGAMGHPWSWREAPEGALPSLALDTARAEALVDLPPATPAALVEEARRAGWRAA